jgi:esterase
MKLLHANIEGSETPLLILHGFLGMGDNWKTLGSRFADNGYEVHMIDQRNHGRSFHDEEFSYEIMAEDLKNYCDQKNLKNFILLGHSMGGKTAMFFASKYPEQVSKLIVVDIAPRQYPQHHQDILKGLSSLDFKAMDSRDDADDQLKKYISNLGIRQFLLKNLYRIGQDNFALRINLPVLVENIEEVGKALPEEAKYTGEVLFIRGERSDYIKDEDMLQIQTHFPKAKLVVVPKSGHWLHAENPEGFYNQVMEFLD